MSVRSRTATRLAELWRLDPPPWPEARVLALAEDVARSLAALHGSGLHLADGLRADRIAVDAAGRCRLDPAAPLGRSAPGAAGPDADVYRFGILLMVALSGLPADQVAAAVERGVRPSALVGRRLRPGFEFLLGRCLSARADRRYPGGVELWADLGPLVARNGPLPPPGLPAPPSPRARGGRLQALAGALRRMARRWRGAVALALALLLAGGIAFFVTYGAAGHQARLRLSPRLRGPDAGTDASTTPAANDEAPSRAGNVSAGVEP